MKWLLLLSLIPHIVMAQSTSGCCPGFAKEPKDIIGDDSIASSCMLCEKIETLTLDEANAKIKELTGAKEKDVKGILKVCKEEQDKILKTMQSISKLYNSIHSKKEYTFHKILEHFLQNHETGTFKAVKKYFDESNEPPQTCNNDEVKIEDNTIEKTNEKIKEQLVLLLQQHDQMQTNCVDAYEHSGIEEIIVNKILLINSIK